MTIAAGVWGMVTVRLLGPPAIEHDGRPARPPRGRKAWALLAYLLLAPRPPGRGHLAELLFADAADPLGALRWTLAELRRALGAPGALTGDPVKPDLHVAAPPGALGKIEERATARSLQVSKILLVDDPGDLPEPCRVRADLYEHSFESSLF